MGFEGGESAMRVRGWEGWDMLGYGQMVEVEFWKGEEGGFGFCECVFDCWKWYVKASLRVVIVCYA